MTFPLKPQHGGFLRPFGCGWFVREFLLGHSPYDSVSIDPRVGAPQSDIFHQYKMAIIKATAMDRATRTEEKKARKGKRPINPDNIEKLADSYTIRLPYKTSACRYHSFVTYFAMLQKLGWVELSGHEEQSSFQDNYPGSQPRKYFRLTRAGINAGDRDWLNPHLTLYGGRLSK
jgi:hypothetical protein